MSNRTSRRTTPTTSTRDRMVAGAADLLRRRGVTATSLREVVRHTRTPRGSLAHHFPGGKQQLLEEAVAYAGQHVTRALDDALRVHGALGGMRHFFGQWCTMLEATDFEAGCPVMAVAIEHEDATSAREPVAGLAALAHAAFNDWTDLLAAALRREGLEAARAHSLAALVVAAFEGAIGLSRAARDAAPLAEVAAELEQIVGAGLAASPPRERPARSRRGTRPG